MEPTEKQKAAYHEAGHALMKFLRLDVCGDLSITDDGEGYCSGTGLHFRNVSDSIKVYLAGYAAQLIFTGQDHSPIELFRTATSTFDFKMAVALIRKDPVTKFVFGARGGGKAFVSYWSRVQEELREHWHAVEVLAERLFVSGLIFDGEAKGILEDLV